MGANYLEGRNYKREGGKLFQVFTLFGVLILEFIIFKGSTSDGSNILGVQNFWGVNMLGYQHS